MGVPVDSAGKPIQIQFNLILSDFNMFMHQLGSLGWKAIGPLFLGCMIVGTLVSASCFITIRVLWRYHIYRAWHHRRERRRRKH